MSSTIVVPELSESIAEARVGRWHKKEGDRVSAGDVLVELETDKIDLEVGAESSGVLATILHEEGDEVHVGDELAVIEPADEERDAPEGEKRDADSDAESDGEEDESDAESDGEEDESDAESDGEEDEPDRRPRETADEDGATKDDGGIGRPASPSARRFAREKDVNLEEVARESGNDRLTRDDVEQFLERRNEVEAEEDEERARESPGRGRREELVRMSSRRRTIARRLVDAQRNSAMLTTFNEIDMGALLEVRERQKARFLERHRVSLGIVSFFVRASVGALREFPRLNAEVRADSMLVKHYYDIGVAVGDPEGLVVPVVRDADRLSLASIEKRIKELAAKADGDELTPEDLSGGTFTITNGGVFGSLLSTPILNPPQVGILGLHKIEERPVAVDGRMRLRPMMYVALSYDHRIVDGLEAVQFLGRVKELIEDPDELLLES